MATIKLYKTTSGKDVVDKVLNNELSIQGAFRGSVDLFDGTLVTETDPSAYNYALFNGKYYYLGVPMIVREGLWETEMVEDVLMTLKDEIRTLRGTVDRQENKYNGYLNDSQYKALSYKQIVTKSFPSGLNDNAIVLMTVG